MTDQQIIDTILAHEGSAYTNDPKDAGGPTRWGITLVNLSNWRGYLCTANDVKNLTREEASAIYRGQYIRPFDKIPDPLRINVVDMGVNAGLFRATVLLQQMVGTTVDSWIGEQTIKAIAVRPAAEWNTLYVGFRLAFYEDLIVSKPTNMKWRDGWRNRAFTFLAAQPTAARAITRGSSFTMAKAA